MVLNPNPKARDANAVGLKVTSGVITRISMSLKAVGKGVDADIRQTYRL